MDQAVGLETLVHVLVEHAKLSHGGTSTTTVLRQTIIPIPGTVDQLCHQCSTSVRHPH